MLNVPLDTVGHFGEGFYTSDDATSSVKANIRLQSHQTHFTMCSRDCSKKQELLQTTKTLCISVLCSVSWFYRKSHYGISEKPILCFHNSNCTNILVDKGHWNNSSTPPASLAGIVSFAHVHVYFNASVRDCNSRLYCDSWNKIICDLRLTVYKHQSQAPLTKLSCSDISFLYRYAYSFCQQSLLLNKLFII